MFEVSVDVQVQAQISTEGKGWKGSRQVPTFVLPSRVLGMRSWDDCGIRAIDILFPVSIPPEVSGVSIVLMTMNDTAETATCTYVRRFGAQGFTQV